MAPGTAETVDDLIDRARQAQAAGGPMMLRPAEIGLLIMAANKSVTLDQVLQDLDGLDFSSVDPEPKIVVSVLTFGSLTKDRVAELLPDALNLVRDRILSGLPAAIVDFPCDVEPPADG